LTFTTRLTGFWVIELDENVRPVGEPRQVVPSGTERVAWGSCFLGSDEWIAYHSSDTGNFELYVTHLDDPTRHFQLTSDGAIFPSFDPVESDIIYSQIGSDILTAVSIEFPVEGGDPIFGTPQPLFRLPVRELDNSVDVHGDEIILGSGPRSDRASIPLIVADWRRLLTD
jgi:hypothetical protein